VAGAAVKNPQRFRDRKPPQAHGALGEPPDWMGGEQRIVWKQFAAEIPWLNASHRGLVEIATTIRARLVMGQDVGVQALGLLRQCLGQMGATPADASKVNVPDAADEDPDDAFFNRPN
jgi:hypothetical protein